MYVCRLASDRFELVVCAHQLLQHRACFEAVGLWQFGARQLLSDGSMDWLRGEVIVSLIIPLLFVPPRVVSAIAIWKRYSPTALNGIAQET